VRDNMANISIEVKGKQILFDVPIEVKQYILALERHIYNRDPYAGFGGVDTLTIDYPGRWGGLNEK
jgi:hypothetical protein